jgi:hypothetical protein
VSGPLPAVGELAGGAGAARSFGAMRIPKMDQEILQTVLPAYREDEFV